jgi:hypothetical protein
MIAASLKLRAGELRAREVESRSTLGHRHDAVGFNPRYANPSTSRKSGLRTETQGGEWRRHSASPGRVSGDFPSVTSL